MTPLSTDERRALALLAALLLLASTARWLERPRNILGDVADLDVAELEEQSRAAQKEGSPTPRRTPSSTARRAPARTDSLGTAPAGYPTAATGEPKPAAADSSPIDLNTAHAVQLQRISGIGPAIAQRLIARRDSLGRFRSYHDVDSVRGIGPALLARIQAASVIH